MIYKVRLIVILDSGRSIASKIYEVDEAGLQDYENRVKWGTMNTMEPFIVEDEKGNRVNIRPDKIESTVVMRLEVRDERPITSFADEAVLREVKGQMTKPAPAPRSPRFERVTPPVREESGTGPAKVPNPTSPSNFSGGLKVMSLKNAFRPPQPKVRERVQTESGPMDITITTDVSALRRQVGVSVGAEERAEERTQPLPKISENDSEPVLTGQKGDK